MVPASAGFTRSPLLFLPCHCGHGERAEETCSGGAETYQATKAAWVYGQLYSLSVLCQVSQPSSEGAAITTVCPGDRNGVVWGSRAECRSCLTWTDSTIIPCLQQCSATQSQSLKLLRCLPFALGHSWGRSCKAGQRKEQHFSSLPHTSLLAKPATNVRRCHLNRLSLRVHPTHWVQGLGHVVPAFKERKGVPSSAPRTWQKRITPLVRAWEPARNKQLCLRQTGQYSHSPSTAVRYSHLLCLQHLRFKERQLWSQYSLWH